MTYSQLIGHNSRCKSCFNDWWIDLHHESISHLFVKRHLESFIWVKSNAQVFFNSLHGLNAIDTRIVKFSWNCAHLANLDLEALILSLLTLVCFDLNIIENRNFFLQIALDISALGFRDIFYCVLFTFQLSNLFAGIHHFLSELHDFVFKLIDWCFETERLLSSHKWLVRLLTHDVRSYSSKAGTAFRCTKSPIAHATRTETWSIERITVTLRRLLR